MVQFHVMIFLIFGAQSTFAMVQSIPNPSTPHQMASPLRQCLEKSLKGKNPLERDQARMECVYKYKEQINLRMCEKIAKSLEYSSFEDQLKNSCLNDLSTETTFKECFRVATTMVDPSEDAKWNCIKRFERTLTRPECLRAAREMKFSYNRDRLESHCLSELPETQPKR